MYEILNKDFNADATLVVNYDVSYDYLTFYIKSSGNTDYIQSSDHLYLIIDLDSSKVIGAKVMGFLNYFSLEELNNLEYPNVANTVKTLYNRISNTPYSK